MSTIAMHVLLAAVLALPQSGPQRVGGTRASAPAPTRVAPTADRPAGRPAAPGPALPMRPPGVRVPLHPLAPGGILAGAGRAALPPGAVRTVTDRGVYVLPRGEHVMTRPGGLPARRDVGDVGDLGDMGGASGREHVPGSALGAGDAHGVALFFTGDGFSGPADPPGPSVRPGCPAHGDTCGFAHPIIAPNLAEGLPGAAPPVPLLVPRDPFAMRALERLGLYLRELRAGEVLASTEGRQIVEDTPASTAPEAPDVAQIACARLQRESVLAVVERYEALFGAPGAEGSGVAPQIQSALAHAWQDYTRARGASPQAVEPGSFREFLASDPQQAEALAYVDGLRAIAEELAVSGLTAGEIRRTRATLLGPITPPGVSLAQLDEAMMSVGE